MIVILLVLQLVSTLAMVGLIWFVQVVHYPLFSQVGRAEFCNYERCHQRLTSLVVIPLMLTEAISATLLLWFCPDSIPMIAVEIGVLLVVILWVSTFLLQAPAHERLAKAFDPATHRLLVRSNWLRTVVWTLRGVLVCWMTVHAMVAGEGFSRQLGTRTAEFQIGVGLSGKAVHACGTNEISPARFLLESFESGHTLFEDSVHPANLMNLVRHAVDGGGGRILDDLEPALKAVQAATVMTYQASIG